jgi:quinol monooxygenase YgiN
VFQSAFDPDKLVLLELWKDQAALDAHAKLQAQRPTLPEGLRLGARGR